MTDRAETTVDGTKIGGRPKIQDVARQAGVSVATVSRALSQPERVREATLKRVLAVVHETGYQSNQIAVQLRTGASRAFLVLVSDITNAFYSEFFKGIEGQSRKRGYIPLIGDTSSDPRAEEHYFQILSSRKADGLIWNVDIAPAVYRNPETRSALRDTPLVLCSTNEALEAPTVRIDNDLGGHLAACHLLDLGHRRFAEIRGRLDFDTNRRRHAGFMQALREAGQSLPAGAAIEEDLSIEYGERAAAWLHGLAERPTAVFVHNDATVLGLLHGLRRLGIEVPGEISVVGYDDMPYARVTAPELTTVRLPKRRWGAAACDVLIDRIEGADVPHEIAMPPELMVRKSTAPPRS